MTVCWCQFQAPIMKGVPCKWQARPDDDLCSLHRAVINAQVKLLMKELELI